VVGLMNELSTVIDHIKRLKLRKIEWTGFQSQIYHLLRTKFDLVEFVRFLNGTALFDVLENEARDLARTGEVFMIDLNTDLVIFDRNEALRLLDLYPSYEIRHHVKTIHKPEYSGVSPRGRFFVTNPHRCRLQVLDHTELSGYCQLHDQTIPPECIVDVMDLDDQSQDESFDEI
jgi:hypothetical protein